MDLGPCPSCGLTPLGNGLLRHELDQLQRSRPGGSWVAEVCERCEGVCVIADPEEGWALGSPSPGPVHRISALTAATGESGPSVATGRPVERPSFAEEVAAPLPDPILVIERIVAEVTGEPATAPAEDPAGEPAPATTSGPGGPTARTMLPESWAYAAK